MAQSRREFLKSAGAVGAVAVAGRSSAVGGARLQRELLTPTTTH